MEQMNLFAGTKPFKVDKPIRLIELFAGIGSQAKALKNLGADFEHYRICEFDKYAVKSYNAIHGTNFETSDITKITAEDLGVVNTDTYCYIMTYSFPCQDLSIAGKQNGMEKGSNTRSGLLWEVERLLDECTELPQVLLMENVTQVHGKKNIDCFNQWCDKLESLGYKNYWQDLNAKDFGIPQSRNRTFMVSLLGNYTYEFPEGFPLEIRLKDVLEDEVDEKYYLSSIANEKLFRHKNKIVENDTPEISNTIHAGYFKMGGRDQQYIKEEPCVKQIVKVRKYPVDCKVLCECLRNHKTTLRLTNQHIADELDIPLTKVEHWFRQDDCFAIPDPEVWIDLKRLLEIETDEFDESIMTFEEREGVFEKSNRCYFSNGIAPTITSASADEKIIEPLAYDEQNQYIRKDGCVGTLTTDGSSPKHNNRIIEVWDGFNQRVRADSSTVGTLTQNCGADLKRNGQGIITYEGELRIRKLTPKECWRLMGFTDADFEKAEAVNSNTQLYKQAGNSIVVDVLMAIFSKLF